MSAEERLRDEIESAAIVTTKDFLVQAVDFSSDELDRFDAAAQRKIADLGGAVCVAIALVYMAERLSIAGEQIENGLNRIAEDLAVLSTGENKAKP